MVSTVGGQVKQKLEEIERLKQGEPDPEELAAAKEVQNQRNKQVMVHRGVNQRKRTVVTKCLPCT